MIENNNYNIHYNVISNDNLTCVKDLLGLYCFNWSNACRFYSKTKMMSTIIYPNKYAEKFKLLFLSFGF